MPRTAPPQNPGRISGPAGQRALTEVAARAFLASSRVPFVSSMLVSDETALATATTMIDGELVLKGAAPWLLHKTDVGLVRVGVSRSEAARVFRDLMDLGRPHGGLDGVLVQPRLQGHEMLVGLRRDPRLGAFVVIGMGGQLAELLDDVVVVPAEASLRTFERSIRTLRGAALLRGFRGMPSASTHALAAVARLVGRLAAAHPEVVELDLNPVFVTSDRAIAADARIIIGPPVDGPRASLHDLTRLFDPRSIAVVGTSSDSNKLGARALRYLVAGGYQGNIYAVHPTAERLQGIPVARTVGEIHPTPDLVSVLVPAAQVAGIVDECIDAGVRAVVVHSAEFGQGDLRARRREQAVLDRATSKGTIICGPNSMGIMSPGEAIYASFAGVLEAMPLPSGSIGLVSQSGAIASSLLSRAGDEGVGFSRWASTGNEADIDVADVLGFLAHDAPTSLVIGYIESIRRGAAFRQAAECLREQRKPLIVYQGGMTELGRDVIASHTGALAPAPRLTSAFLASVGAVRAPTLASMLMAAMIVERQGVPNGDRTAIVTMSGAAAGVCADLAERTGLRLARFQRNTRSQLRRLIPASGRVENPVDVTAHAMADPTILVEVLDMLIADPGVDQIVVQLTTNADPAAATIATAIGDRAGTPGMPSTTLLVSRLGSPRLAPRAVETFRHQRIPVMTWPEDAVAAAYVSGAVGRTMSR